VIVRVLGSAAGGGVPQWNCACANCRAAREGRQPRRSSSSFAFSADGARWWLVNASPDVAQQIEAFPALTPGAGRGTPLAGMLLTDANIDHVGGFAVLRQQGEHRFDIFSSASVRDILLGQPEFAPFAAPPHRWDAVGLGGVFELAGTLQVRVVELPGLTPGYAGRIARRDAVVAYLVADSATGGSALFAPVFAECADGLLAAARAATVAFFDGSFWSDDELDGVGVAKSARALGHAPISGDGGTLARLAALPPGGRRYFAHLNNTNPALDPASRAHAAIARAGLALAEDGLQLEV